MDKEFPQGHLRRARVIKVTPKDGFWECPSCNEKNKELQDICWNCGQEVDNGKKTEDKREKVKFYGRGHYERLYCPDCKLIWGKNSIDRVTKCNKCGTYLTLENFDPFKKSILGVVVIAGGCLTFFIKEVPIMWFGGFLWGISIIVTAFQNWGKIKKLDGDVQEKKIKFRFEFIRKFLNNRKNFIIECSSCKQKLRIPRIRKNLKVTCPKCRNIIHLTPVSFFSRLTSIFKIKEQNETQY